MHRKRKVRNQYNHLSAGFTVEDLIASFTDPEKKFEFPIKAIEVTLAKEDRDMVIVAASILALGAFGAAYIASSRR